MKKFFKKVSSLYHHPRRALHKASDSLHSRLMNKGGRYHRWHQSAYRRIVHFGTLALYTLIILVIVLAQLLPQKVIGAANVTHNQPTNTAFNAAGAEGASVEISGTEVKLAADADWWHTGFQYKRPVTITNTQGTAIAAGTTVTLTMDTKQFVDAGKMQSDGDDLRIAYKNGANDWSEARRVFSYLGSETFATSQRTQVTFTTAAQIALSGSDANYGLYYGNATVNYNWSNALTFDGDNDYVDCSNPESLQITNGTVEFWLRTSEAAPEPHESLIRKDDVFYIMLTDKVLRIYDWGGGGFKSTGVNLGNGRWHHVAVTFMSGVNNGTNVYVNGVLKLTTTTSVTSQTHKVFIGVHSNLTSYNYKGIIDETRISNNIRYVGGRFNVPVEELSTDANTAGLWHFDEGTGPTAGDSSGNGNDGTLKPDEATGPQWTNPTQQSFPDETFVAPFNATTTGMDGETPSSFTRNSVATYEDENGIIQEVSANTPRYETGYRGKNLSKTSSFETDGNSDGVADNWGKTFNAQSTYSLSDESVHGTKSQAITFNASSLANEGIEQNPGMGTWPAGTYSLSAMVKTSGPSINVYVNGECGGSSSVVAVTGSWQRIRANNLTGGCNGRIFVRTGGTYTSETLYIDAVMFTFGTITSDYVPTTTQPMDNNRGIIIEEQRMNYLKTSSFETDSNSDGVADNWGKGGNTTNPPTYSIDASYYKHNSKSQRIQYTGVAGDSGKYFQLFSDLTGVGTFAPDDIASGSVYYRGSTSGVTLGLTVHWYDAAGGWISGDTSSVFPTPSSAWQRFTNTTTAAPANTSQAKVEIIISNVDDGDTVDIYFDAAQLEEGAFATSYIPTTTAAVTRAKDNLSYATSGNILANMGTISLWVKPNYHYDNSGTEFGYFSVNGFSDGIVMYYAQASDQYTVYYKNNFKQGAAHTSSNDIYNTWTHLAFAYNSDTDSYVLYENGVAYTMSITATELTLPVSFYLNNTGSGNNTTSDLRIYNTALSATQVADIYRSGLAYYSEGSEGVARYASTGTYTSPVLDFANNAGWQAVPNFVPTATLNGGTISYQTRVGPIGHATPDGEWTDWQNVAGGNSIQNPGFPKKRYFQWKGTFTPPGGQANSPVLTSLDVKYLQDTENPTNPDTINAWDSAAKGTQYTDGGWGSATAPDGPYFEWSGATDDDNVYGYYVYFGTDNTADPLTAGSYQTGTSFTNSTDLTQGQTYYLRIRAEDRAGNVYTNVDTSVYSLFTYSYDGENPPSPEYINVSPAGCSTVAVFTFTWPEPTDVGSGIDHYIYKLGSTGTEQTTTETSVEAAPYQEGDNVFYLKAVDKAGNSSTYWQTGVFCSTGAALIVDGPTVTAGPSSLTVSWVSSKKTTSYVRVYQGNTYISEQGHTEYSASHNVQVVGLKSEQAYRYKLVWIDEDGNSGESIWYETNTAATPRVIDLKVNVLSPTKALVSWRTNYLASAVIEYGIGGYNKKIGLEGEATNFSHQVEDLSPGSNYQLGIKATTSDGAEFSGGVTFTTPPFPTISNVRFDYIPEARATIRVTWNTNVNTDSVVTYTNTVTDKTDEESSSKMAKDHSITLSGLLDSTEYIIVVSGRDQYGNRAVSDPQKYTTPLDTRPPVISDLEVEYRTVGTGKEAKAQIIISWKTDEPASSQVAYGEGMTPTFTFQSTKDESLVTDHLVILRDLETAQIYHLRAVSEDKGNNTTNSETRIIVTPKAQESVLDIILNVFKDSFGWLINLFK